MNPAMFVLFGLVLIFYMMLRIVLPRYLEEPDAVCIFLLAPFAMLAFPSLIIGMGLLSPDQYGWQPHPVVLILPAAISALLLLDGLLLLKKRLRNPFEAESE